jgi:translocation and assembly module TamA
LGDITIHGLEQVKRAFVFNRIPWKNGDMYDPGVLEGFRSDLSSLDLFSSIKIAVPEQNESTDLKEPQLTPVNINVKERQFRFFGFGGDFSTTEGIGLNAFWGHRNFFGRGEKLKVTGRLARLGENNLSNSDQKLILDFQKPDFLSRKQNLLFNAELVNENPDAFKRKAIVGSLGISRPASKLRTSGRSIRAPFRWNSKKCSMKIRSASGKRSIRMVEPVGAQSTTQTSISPISSTS